MKLPSRAGAFPENFAAAVVAVEDCPAQRRHADEATLFLRHVNHDPAGKVDQEPRVHRTQLTISAHVSTQALTYKVCGQVQTS